MRFYLLAIFLSIFVSCKQKTTQAPKKSITQKIAFANGFENWRNVSKIEFTFNVDRDTIHVERSWIWDRQAKSVTKISDQDTITYSRLNIDSLTLKSDRQFINDKFWLLAPFNLSWDKNLTVNHKLSAEAPISKELMQKVTVVYPDKGGYTPGDAYDFYFKDDYLIREWVFRKSNGEKPNLITTWENYIDINGIKIAQTHKNGNFKLYFTNLKIN